MKIYHTQLNWDDDMRTHVPSCGILEQEPQTRFSGLYDADGNKLMVTERTDPIGFVVFNSK